MMTSTLFAVHRQVFEIALAEFHVGDAHPLALDGGAFDHFGGHVHADDMSRLTDLFRGEEAVQSRARAEVEDGLTGLERCQRDRIAASVADRGFARGQAGEQIDRVEVAVGGTAIRRSATGGVVLDPLCIMLADRVVDGGGGLVVMGVSLNRSLSI